MQGLLVCGVSVKKTLLPYMFKDSTCVQHKEIATLYLRTVGVSCTVYVLGAL